MHSNNSGMTKNVIITFSSVVLILFAVLLISIATLIFVDHSYISEGGFLYSFLPPYKSSEIQVLAQTPETHNELDLLYEALAYERMLYEMMQYEIMSINDYFPDENVSIIATQLPPIVSAELPPLPPPLVMEVAEVVYSSSPFSVFSFFIPQNSEFYEYLHYNRPYLEKDAVVWKVNVYLHLPFYTYILTNYDDPNPLLVNPFYRLPEGFRPNQLVPVNNPNCNLRATPEAVAAFHLLRESAQQIGLNLSVTSAFRTAAHQHRLWERRNFTDGVVARPYHSEHQTGRALDLWGPHGLLDSRGATATGVWVAENAHRYGFIIRYRADTTHITSYIHEPWHITYVGTVISMYMYENNILSLEEFVGRNPGATLDWGVII